MSDHSVLKLSLKMSVNRVSTDDKIRWDKGDYCNLCKFLDINWEDISDVSTATVDEMWENFKQIVIDGMNLFIPRGNQRLKRSNKNHQPFNNELKRLIKDKHRLWKKWIASRDRTVYENYKKVRNRVKKVTTKLCQEEQQKISLECKRNPLKFWQYVNKKTKFKTAVSDLHWMDSNGKQVTAENDSDKAAALQVGVCFVECRNAMEL